MPDRRVADRGSVTVETAVGLAAIAVVVAACLGGMGCVLVQMRCADAAREAARLAARDDHDGAAAALARLAPSGAAVEYSDDGRLLTVRVTAPGPLAGFRLTAEASAAFEGSPPP